MPSPHLGAKQYVRITEVGTPRKLVLLSDLIEVARNDPRLTLIKTPGYLGKGFRDNWTRATEGEIHLVSSYEFKPVLVVPLRERTVVTPMLDSEDGRQVQRSICILYLSDLLKPREEGGGQGTGSAVHGEDIPLSLNKPNSSPDIEAIYRNVVAIPRRERE